MLPQDGMKLLICATFKDIADLVMSGRRLLPVSRYFRFIDMLEQ